MVVIYLQHDFVHAIKVTQILDHIATVSVSVDDGSAGMATLRNQSPNWPFLGPEKVSSQSYVLD